MIAREGRGWIGIHELVEHVGVTKGSFYWHFKNREDFVTALLDYWFETSTSTVAQDLSDSGASAEERLLQLAIQIVESKLDEFNLPIIVWGLRESIVATALRKVERFRWNYVKSLFHEIGFRGDELVMRTRTFVVFYTLEAAIPIKTSKAGRLRRVQQRHLMLVRKP